MDDTETPIISAGLTLYPSHCRAIWQGKKHRLGPTQISILKALLDADGQLVSARRLMSDAGYRGDRHAENLKVHLSRIRKLMPGLPIYNDAGVGYAWRPQSPQSPEDG